ncbi:Calx-beta domain-containing protein, partial [Microcystis sp. T1-4]|uniref:Calx-beta domain-containing protein n=1 Tax=Microcystis sp. T1-4 TaxID=1160279 RepID=UPI00058799FF
MLNNPGVLAFSAPTYTLTENGTTITQVTVTRTGGSDTEVSGTITLNNGTATAEDYNNTPIKVTFAHGDSAPKIITIPIKEDSQFEAVETLNLSLTNPTNGVTIGTQNTAIVKIIDNDNFVFNNTDIQPTKLEKLTLPIPTALKQYEILSSELDKAKVKLDTTEEQLRLANDDYSFAKETFEGSLIKQKFLTESLQNLANKKTALTSSFTQSKTEIEQKQKDIQKNIDNAYARLKAETNAGIKDGIQKEINGYLIQIQEQQNLLSIATTKYNQELAGVIFQIDDSNQELQGLESNIIPKQVEDLEKKNQALVDIKTAWEGNKQAVTVADKALGDFLTDYAFLKTQDYSSKFLQDTVDSLKQKIGALQANLTALKSGNGSNSEIAALEKAILEKQKIVGEVQDYQKTVLAGELEFKQELETRKGTSADHEASVKVALGNNNIEGYVSLNSQLANQLKGLTTVWVDNLEDNHNLTIKVWNGSQATSQAFDSLTSYIDENLATPYGDYYLNEIQLDEALQIRESTVRRRDALADSVDFVEDALFLAKKNSDEYQNLAKLSQHYSDLTKYEKEFNQLNVVQGKRAIVSQFQQQLPGTQDIVQAKTSLNNALDDLLKSLDGSILHDVDSLKANIIQNKSLSDAYLDQAKSYSDQAKSYSDQAAVYWEKSHKQGPQWVEYIQVERTKWSGLKKKKYWESVPVYHDDPDWVLWDDYTKKSQALQQQSSDTIKLSVNVVQLVADNVNTFIDKSKVFLQPKLIKAVSDEVTNKSQDLVVQIDLTNDQQEQGIETNLQKYIKQKQNKILDVKNQQLKSVDITQTNLAFSSQQGGFNALNITSAVFGLGYDNRHRFMADVNGDGRADFGRFEGGGNGTPISLYFNLAGENGFTNQ